MRSPDCYYLQTVHIPHVRQRPHRRLSKEIAVGYKRGGSWSKSLTVKKTRRDARAFKPPLTISNPSLLDAEGDGRFRQIVYLMVTTFGRLLDCRDAFGRAVGLTGSQYAVLIGTAYTQGSDGVTIGQLADHVQLAATHVTTEVGRLCRRGLLEKRDNPQDRRSVLVRLTREGEARVRDLAPFVRDVNDILFEGVSDKGFDDLERFLTRFARQTERAIAEIRAREAGPRET